jgi:hypothetical protein
MLYRICRSLVRFYFAVFCRWKVEGAEYLPEQGPVVVAANHFSYWDPIVLACALDRKVHDELIFELPEEELEILIPLVRSGMEKVVELDVPLKVGIEAGYNWNDMQDVD